MEVVTDSSTKKKRTMARIRYIYLCIFSIAVIIVSVYSPSMLPSLTPSVMSGGSGNGTVTGGERIESQIILNYPLTLLQSNTSDSCTSNMPHNWFCDKGNTPRYVTKSDYATNMTQHYTHEGYEKCLAKKTVVFIGDSRVRYQFMNLADFLISEKFMNCQDHGNYTMQNRDPACYLVQERIPEVWTNWYRNTTNMLKSNTSLQQDSLCDCFRAPKFKPAEVYENRFIQRSTPFGQVNLVYLNNFVNKITMNEDYPPFSPFVSSKRCAPGYCGPLNRTDVFIGNLNDTLWNILPKLNTTHAFVSLGWEHLHGFDSQSKFSCELQNFEKHHPGIKVFLISHPPTRNHLSEPMKYFNATNLKCKIGVLDRTITNANINSAWYWDNQHVLGIMNEEYNHQMIKKVCPL